jgi:hypothetical protein
MPPSPFPFNLDRVSPDDLKRFRQLYEASVKPQPLDDLGQWFLDTYRVVEAGNWTEALNRFDMVLSGSPDYTAFAVARHLLGQARPGSAVHYQITRRLLGGRSPLLVRYGLCLVIAGEALVDREIATVVANISRCGDEETASFISLARLALDNGWCRNA